MHKPQERSKIQTLLKVFGTIGLLTLLAACATKVSVIDSSSDVVKLADDVKGHVYTWQTNGNAGQWTKSANKVSLPQGWMAGPGPH